MTSAKLMPAARTSMRTCPGPGDGSGRSCTCRTEGSPCWVMTTARMARTLSPPKVQAECPRGGAGQPGERIDGGARLLQELAPQRRGAHERPAEPGQRLARDADRRRLDDGQARQRIAIVERQRG